MRILLAGGGTAGHTSPLLATADALRRLDPDCEITCLGTPRGLENRVVPEAGYPLELVPPVPLPRKLSADLFRVPARLRAAVKETRGDPRPGAARCGRRLRRLRLVPPYLAARKAKAADRRPRAERAAGPGNRLGARVAARVAVSFPDTRLPKAEYVGLPIRRMISTLDRDALRAEAREFFGLDPDRPTLVVTGGSQGARSVNDRGLGGRRALAAAGVQVLHVVGPKNGTASPLRRPCPPTSGRPFVDRMDYALAAADLMVCRAGANSVTEAAAVGVPAVFVPLPIGNGEQELNARPVVDAGGALLVADDDFTAAVGVRARTAARHGPGAARRDGRAASALIPRDADEKLARIVLEVGA